MLALACSRVAYSSWWTSSFLILPSFHITPHGRCLATSSAPSDLSGSASLRVLLGLGSSLRASANGVNAGALLRPPKQSSGHSLPATGGHAPTRTIASDAARSA